VSLLDFASTAHGKIRPLLRQLARSLACLSLALAGCATYRPPDLPPQKKATIYLTQFPYAMSFQKMDGANVAWASTWRTVKIKSLEIAPGKHTVTILVTMRFFTDTFDGSTDVSFVAKPGKAYVIKSLIDSSDHQDLRVWVEQSKQKVPDPF
jgi:hypothetical protein